MPQDRRRTSSPGGTGRPATAPGTRELLLLLAIGVAAAAVSPVPVGAQCVAPGTPANPSPAAGATLSDGNVMFTWSAVSGTAPITYQVLLDGLNVVCTTAATSCTLAGVVGSHNWRVTASNACGSTTGGPWTFTVNVACTPASTPTNPSPASGTTVNSASATLSWSPAAGTSPITYSVFVDSTATARCTTTSTSCAVGGLTAGAHDWYVRAANCGGNSAMAGPWRLMANPPCETPGVATPTSPASGAVGVGASPLLQWQAPATGSAPFRYDVYLDETKVAGCADLETPSCQLAGLTVDAVARTWRVVAKNACGSMTSATRTFVTCAQTAVPVAAFTVEPSGTVLVGGVTQAQPYVGQQVTLRGAASNGPVIEWSWYDFGSVGVLRKTQDVTYVWDTAGSKNVRLIARNCAGSSPELLQAVVIHQDVRPVAASFSWAPAPGQAGAAVTFSAATGAAYGDPTAFEWTFPGGVTRTGASVDHAFACAGTHQVSLVAARGSVASAPTTRAVTVAGSPLCCAAPNRAGSPVPANGATIPGGPVTLRWERPTQGTDPLRYDVILDGATVPGCTNIAARECVVSVAEGTATHLWKVIARSSCGSTTDIDTPSEWRFRACSAPSAPDATGFTWQPNGEVVVGGVVQQQPYPGQEVRFSYAPTVTATAMSWTDYQKVPAVVYDGVASPTVVYTSSGDKKMYLRASNCAGSRAITQYVRVFPDVRPVAAKFTIAPADPAALELVTITFDTSTAAGSPDQFTVDFGDGTPPETVSAGFVQHAFRCGRTYRLAVTARRTRFGSKAASAESAADLPVSGQACSPSGFLVVDVPQLVVRSDGLREAGGVAVFNPSDETMELVLSVRDTGSGDLKTRLALPLLAPKAYLGLADLAALAGLDFARATLWLESAAPGATTVPVLNAWSYLERSSGQRYWQHLPVAEIWPPAADARTLWISGLVHNSLNAERGRYGSITRLTFVDPTVSDPGRTPWGSRKLILRLFDGRTGQLLRTDSLNLETFAGYRSDYINRIFHLADGQDFGPVMVRVDVPAGVSVVATAAVVDNATGSTRLSAAK